MYKIQHRKIYLFVYDTNKINQRKTYSAQIHWKYNNLWFKLIRKTIIFILEKK